MNAGSTWIGIGLAALITGASAAPTQAVLSTTLSSPADVMTLGHSGPTVEDSDPVVPMPGFHWPLDGDGDALVGEEGLAFSGAYELTGEAVPFDGRTGFAATTAPGPVVTTDSFSVATWVHLDHAVDYSSAVSQLGDVAAAFGLGYVEGSWGFHMKSADTNEPGSTVRAQSDPVIPSRSAWVHLVGVYDHGAQEIRLYVDGQAAAKTAFIATWQAQGALTVGRSQAHGAPADFWPGAIDDVRIYPVALDDRSVREVHRDHRPTTPPPSMPTPSSVQHGDFEMQRDDICRSGSLAIAAINATIEGAAPADVAVGLRRVAEQIEMTQSALDELDVPDSWARFVEADNERRAERIRLVYELADAIEQEDTQSAQTVDQELTELNVATEAAEDEHGLQHCP